MTGAQKTRLIAVAVFACGLANASFATEHERVIYKDATTGIIFYVESDGRHVAAIAKGGKLLWVRDPFVDAHLKPYRTPLPIIDYVGPAKTGYEKIIDKGAKFIEIHFNSSQFGILDVKDGHFRPLGQD